MLGMVSYWVDHGWRSSGMFWEGTSIYYSHQRFSYAPELVLRFEPRTTSRTESRNLPWKNPWPTCDLVGWLTPKKRKRGDVCFHYTYIYICMYVCVKNCQPIIYACFYFGDNISSYHTWFVWMQNTPFRHRWIWGENRYKSLEVRLKLDSVWIRRAKSWCVCGTVYT